MNNLDLLKMMAAREAYNFPPKAVEKGLSWFSMMESMPLFYGEYWGYSETGDGYGEATDQSPKEVHSGATEEDRKKAG